MQSLPRCWAEVDLTALRENLAWLRHRVGPGVKVLTVVKADAYGHGLKQIAALLMQSGTDIFGVANLAEAHGIRAVGKGWPILMLGACLPDEVELAVRDDVRPTISSAAEAGAFSAAAGKFHKTVLVHIKIDTGMGRLGIRASDALDCIREIRAFPGLRLEGIYTHFASVEDDAEFSREQAMRFRSVLKELAADRIRFPLVHANNSGAMLFESGTTFNLVRPGLLVYGVVPSGRRRFAWALHHHLRPALSFKCRVSLVKEIAKGASLSYGRTFIAARKLRVATITAGYGDGYLRSGSNRAEVLIHGRRCRVLGRITMDQMLVNVSHLKRVTPGEEVVLVGRQGSDQITATEVAGWCQTIPWEVLTHISHRVPRIYRGASAA